MIRVSVYWNLHKHRWSLRAEEGPHKGRVIGHATQVLLRDVTFKVSEAGRQRVLQERRKNVHAFARGIVQTCWGFAPTAEECPRIAARGEVNAKTIRTYSELRVADGEATTVHYNPFRWSTFVDVEERPVYAAAALLLVDNRRLIAERAVTAATTGEGDLCESA